MNLLFWKLVFWVGVVGLCLMFPPLFFVVLIVYAFFKITD